MARRADSGDRVGGGRGPRLLAVALSGVLVASGLAVPPAAANPSGGLPDSRDRSVPVSTLPVKVDPLPSMPAFEPEAVRWPQPSSQTVELPLGANGSRRTAEMEIGGLPVRVVPSIGRGDDVLTGRDVADAALSAPARVNVEVLDRKIAEAVGAALVLGVARADNALATGAVRLDIDYSAFRSAYGADWAWRLKPVQLPACALTSPKEPSCADPTTLTYTNDGETSVISAEVELPSQVVAGADASSWGCVHGSGVRLARHGRVA